MNRFLMAVLAAFTLLGLALAQNGDRTTYELPGEGVFPEGITVHEESNSFFVTGAGSGAIYRGDLETGEVTTFFEGERAPFSTIGIHADDQGRLWVAGGGSGNIDVFDIESGELTNTISATQAEGAFLNDLITDSEGNAYVTNTGGTTIYRASTDSESAEEWLDFSGSIIEEQEEGSNLNGIVITEDDQYLIVVKMSTGQLFRIDTESQEITEIDLGGEAVTNGDGLVLDGNMLYVVRNADHEVTAIELSDDYTSGEITDRITHETFAFPATGAIADGHILVTNAQFNAMQDPETPFTVSRVPLPQN